MQTFNNEYTAVVKNEGDWWIGWIEEIPGVNCQERTHRELMESLHVTLIEALEFNRRDVLSASDKMNSINLSRQEKKIIDQRLEAYRKNPDAVSSWGEVCGRMNNT